jgi:DNA-binding transcriptional LysR family regulator
MNDRLHDLLVFVRVAESGSFSRAGQELGHAQPTVSRIIAALEARLGAKLLARTTRELQPTEAGRLLLGKARHLLAEMEDLESSVRGAGGLAGVLRVAVPVTYGAREIVPLLGPFLAAHPDLRVELLMADRRVDLLEEGVDVAVRLGALDDSSLVSRRLASAPRFVAASPAYLAQRGAPLTPADLAEHDVLTAQTSGADVWALRHADGGAVQVRLRARLVATSTEGLVAGVVAGLGLAALSSVACGRELARGEVVRVLEAYAMVPVEIHAIMPAGRIPVPKVRAFVAYLAGALAG